LTKTRSPKEAGGRCVVYYMLRDQRVEDNWAMLYSRHLADLYKVPLRVVFPFATSFDQMSYRQFAFQAAGLKEVESSLRSLNIPFSVPLGTPASTVPSFSLSHSAVAVVTDHLPLRTVRGWNEAIAKALDEASVPLYQVDASCVVPVWVASDKQEVGARTLRPKITKLYQEFLTEFPKLEGNAGPDLVAADRPIDWEGALGALDRTKVDMAVLPVAGFAGGKAAGTRVLDDFLNNKLKGYGEERNDPNKDLQSGLSAYLRFGQVGFQRVALATKSFGKHSSSTASFIEEGVVRRELSDNFCFYNHEYDNIPGGASRWASESLECHRLDPRAYVYDLQQFEEGRTHDDLWNAAQLQLRTSGRMHGFMRMYWAKKILEWSVDAQTALRIAITINDKYAMDGSCPNGYVGVGWSIMGVHDVSVVDLPVIFALAWNLTFSSLLLSLFSFPLLSSPRRWGGRSEVSSVRSGT
jgi:deoxyribodipyrimidine photo-lyase